MPTKKTAAGREYQVDGREFIWTSEDGAELRLPLRLKLKTIRALSGRDLDVDAMFAILEHVVPGQADALDEMDLLFDFQPMFLTWKSEYELLSGASLGEPSGSSS